MGCCHEVAISAFFYLFQKGSHFLASGLVMLMSNWQTPLLLYLSRIKKVIVVCRLQQNWLMKLVWETFVNLKDSPNASFFIQSLSLLSNSRKQIDVTYDKIKHFPKRTYTFIYTTNKTILFSQSHYFGLLHKTKCSSQS